MEDRVSITSEAALAGVCFGVAKISGCIALAMGYLGYPMAGVAFFAIAFLLLATSIFVCVRDIQRRNRAAEIDEDAVMRMLRDGTLRDRLRQEGYNLVTPRAVTERM